MRRWEFMSDAHLLRAVNLRQRAWYMWASDAERTRNVYHYSCMVEELKLRGLEVPQ